MLAKAMRRLRGYFWLIRVSKAVGANVACRKCGSSGRYDPLYDYGVKPGGDTVRTIDCPECTGLGYHFIPEE